MVTWGTNVVLHCNQGNHTNSYTILSQNILKFSKELFPSTQTLVL